MAEICNLILLNGTLSLTNTTGSLNLALGREAALLPSECFVEVTTAVVGTTTAPVVALKQGSTELTTLTIPDGTPAGTILFFALNGGGSSVALADSDQISIVCKTAAAGTPAGAVRAFLGVR